MVCTTLHIQQHTFQLSHLILEKQTMEFNLRVRSSFKKTVRARMGTPERLLFTCHLYINASDARYLGSDGDVEHPCGRL